MAQIDINCSSQPSGILCNVIAENYASHRTFPRTRLAHQQNLLLLLFARLRGGGGGSRLVLDVHITQLLLHIAGEERVDGRWICLFSWMSLSAIIVGWIGLRKGRGSEVAAAPASASPFVSGSSLSGVGLMSEKGRFGEPHSGTREGLVGSIYCSIYAPTSLSLSLFSESK